jgi:hypothetical protein
MRATLVDWPRSGIMLMLRAVAGYYQPKRPLPDTINVDFYEIEQKRRRQFLVVQRIEQLDRELRALGIRPIQALWRD